jgi:hypothetical protein
MVKRGALSLDEIGSGQAFVDIVVVHRSSHIPQSSQIIASPTPAHLWSALLEKYCASSHWELSTLYSVLRLDGTTGSENYLPGHAHSALWTACDFPKCVIAATLN